MKYNQELKELQKLADTKERESLGYIADCDSEDGDCLPGLQAGIKGTNNKYWHVEFDDEYLYFVGASFEEVKKRIEELPNVE